MPTNKPEYMYQYTKDNIKRISFNVRKKYFENTLAPAVKRSGLSVNGFIKAAIDEKISREKE